MRLTYIYTLTDPINGQIRYVGKANNIKKRLSCHLTSSNLIKSSHKNSWIKGLQNLGVNPIIEIIDEIPFDEWEFWEQYWISQIKSWGFKLTNSTNGGDTVIPDIKYGEENYNYNHNVSDEMIMKLINGGYSQKEIASKLHTNIALIYKRTRKYNVNFRKLRGNRMKTNKNLKFRKDITFEIVNELFQKGFTIHKMSVLLNTDRKTIKNRLKEKDEKN